MATLPKQSVEARKARTSDDIPIDPHLLFERTGMTVDELDQELDKLSVEELHQVVDFLRQVELEIRLRAPEVQRVIARADRFLERVEDLIQRSLHVQ